MTVLVTGGAGYIGSHMVHALLDAGEPAVVLDNLATGFDWAVAQGALLLLAKPRLRWRASPKPRSRSMMVAGPTCDFGIASRAGFE